MWAALGRLPRSTLGFGRATGQCRRAFHNAVLHLATSLTCSACWGAFLRRMTLPARVRRFIMGLPTPHVWNPFRRRQRLPLQRQAPRQASSAVCPGTDCRPLPRRDNEIEEMYRSNAVISASMESRWGLPSAGPSLHQTPLPDSTPLSEFIQLLRFRAIALRISRSLRSANMVSLSIAFRTFRATLYRRCGAGKQLRLASSEPESQPQCWCCKMQVYLVRRSQC